MSVLSFHDVCVTLAEKKVLSGINALCAPGQVTGIVGPNGAGKTTLLRVAAGLLPASSGTCKVADRAIAAWSRADLARCVAYLPQGGDVAWSLSVRDVVLLGRLPFGGSLGRPHAADREKAIRALQRADAAAFVARRVDKLSAGERACVLLARALATEADILLADEPAAHLDPAHQLRLMQTLREEARRGSAVVVTLHELALAARYCDRLLVLDNGRVAASGTPDEALGDEILARVFGVSALRATGADGSHALIPWQTL